MNTRFVELLYSKSSEEMRKKEYWGEGKKLTDDHSAAANVFRTIKSESGSGNKNCWYYMGIEGRARDIPSLLKGYFSKLRNIYIGETQEGLLIDKGFCYFAFYWIIKENGDQIDDRLTLWENMLSAAGIPYASAAFSSMEDVIQYYACRKSLDCKDWNSIVSDWAIEKEKYSPNLVIPYPQKELNETRTLTVKQLREITSIGTDETTKETRKSLSEIESYLARIVAVKDACGNTIEEIFNKQFGNNPIPLILDTQVRRNWYFLRILSTIISKQKEMLLEFYEYQGNIEKQFGYDDIKESIWFEIPKGDIKDEDEFEKQIDEANIVIRKIAIGFGRCLDENAYDFDGWIEPVSFEKPEIVFEDRMDVYSDLRDGETFFNSLVLGKNTLSGKIGNATREMLLVSALIAKAYGANISMDYICNNVMFNSRYPDDLTNYNKNEAICMFNKYFAETYSKLDDEGSWPEYLTHMEDYSNDNEGLLECRDYYCRMQCMAEESTKILNYYKNKIIEGENINIFRLMAEGNELFV